MKKQNGRQTDAAQRTRAQVVELPVNRGAMAKQIVNRFRAGKSIHALSIEFGVPHRAVEEPIRESYTSSPPPFLRRAA
jgi:hypothetical protein